MAFTLGFVLCIPHMILKHQIISRFLQTERMLLEKVSPDTSLGSSQFTAWQSGLQVEAQKILACSIMLSRRRQQQRAVEGSSGCWTWRILSSVSTVFAKVLFSMIQLKQITRFDEMFRERRESSQEAGEGLRHRGNGRASGAGVQEQGRR